MIFRATQPKKFIGLDVVKTSVAWAKKHWIKNKKMKFLVADAHHLPFRKACFDAVFCLEALEHVADPLLALKEFKRVMKKMAMEFFLCHLTMTCLKLFGGYGFIFIQEVGYGKKLTFKPIAIIIFL